MTFEEFKRDFEKVKVEGYPNSIVSNPFVSICVQTYQHANYIRHCLDSILMQQTNFDYEILLGEDASTDGTREICIWYAEKYPDKIKLFLHHRKNNIAIGGSPSGRFNFIYNLFSSKGKFLAFCEGDDYWTDPLKLQKQVDFLETNSNYIGCFHQVQVVNQAGDTIKKSKSSSLYNRDVTKEELQKGFVLSISSICFRNVIINYPEEFYKANLGDKFLCSLLGHHGEAKFISDIKPSSYRFHSGGIWSEKSELDKEKAFINSHYWMWKYYERIGNEELANHFFKLILKKGYLSSPFNKKGYGIIDKLEYLSLWGLRRLFRILRYIFRG